MSDRSGIFSGDEPFGIFQSWLDAATASEPNDPNAMSLATIDQDGMPDVRIVLLKGLDERGLVFFTNYQSAKGIQLMRAQVAATCFHWKSLRRQVRFRGKIEKVSAKESDAYYATRPLGSRIGAWASAQSQPIADKSVLKQAFDDMAATHGQAPERPPHWGGFRLEPSEIEFWADGEFRQHDRFRWTRKNDQNQWLITRLNP